MASYLTIGLVTFFCSPFYILVVVVGALTLYHFWFQSTRYAKLGNKLPGRFTLPFIGNAHIAFLIESAADITQFALSLRRDYGTVFRFWYGNRLAVGLTDPRDIELILGSPVHLEKPVEYDLFIPWLGDGLLISKGEIWRTHRKLITPTFHSSILKTFIPVFNQNAKNLVESLRNEVDTVFDVHDYMSSVTVNVLLETAMGITRNSDARDRTGFDYAKAVMDMCNVLHNRQVRIWLRPNIIFRFTKWARDQTKYLKIIHSLTLKVIDIKRANYVRRKSEGHVSLYENELKDELADTEANSNINYGAMLRDDLDDHEDQDVGEKKRLAFLDFMIEAFHADGAKLSDKEIIDEVNTIMFEGHDTTASASSFVLCLLAIHKDIQAKVLQESIEVWPDSKKTITLTEILGMKYLERVILETIRLYPPVPLIGRIIREDVRLASADYILPKDTSVAIGIYSIHRDPHYYKNPDQFDPDNFLPERCQKRHYYSYIPFSAGPRSCVGRKYAMLKLKVILAYVIRNFELIAIQQEYDFRIQADIILKLEKGFPIKLKPRNINKHY